MPYTRDYGGTAECHGCGSRHWSVAEDCESCGAAGCDSCMSLETEAQADPETGHRSWRLICESCHETDVTVECEAGPEDLRMYDESLRQLEEACAMLDQAHASMKSAHVADVWSKRDPSGLSASRIVEHAEGLLAELRAAECECGRPLAGHTHRRAA